MRATKLTPAQRLAIHLSPSSATDLAHHYGVAVSTTTRIKQGLWQSTGGRFSPITGVSD